jgi:3-dehydroquinate synthase
MAADVIMNKHRRVMIVSDTGVPEEYIDTLASSLGDGAHTFIFPEGEGSKSLDTLTELLRAMLSASFTRGDAVVALGGGVVGDLSGFAASMYMLGIDFYKIPTTLLSQVDSSVGGKTAVNIDGYKNMIGTFWQPRAVFIDPSLLVTLPKRHISNGLCEALKISLTSDGELFDIFEKCESFFEENEDGTLLIPPVIDEIIIRAVSAKRDIVERDERENGLRRVLNFGHTAGHGIESATGFGKLLHGECVALGMIPMTSESIRPRLLSVLKKLSLPTSLCEIENSRDDVLSAIAHDKKSSEDGIITVFLDDVEKYRFETLTPSEIIERLYQG